MTIHPTTCEACGRTSDSQATCEACYGVQMEPDYDAMGDELGMDDEPDYLSAGHDSDPADVGF